MVKRFVCLQPSVVQISFRRKIVGLNETMIQLSSDAIPVVERGISIAKMKNGMEFLEIVLQMVRRNEIYRLIVCLRVREASIPIFKIVLCVNCFWFQ